MNILRLSIKNVIAKPLSTGLSLLLLSLGVGLISLMLHVDQHLKAQLNSNIQGIDMVVGAKGSPLQLILSAVFQVDVPTGNIKLSQANTLLKNRLIDYGIPLSYGDSFKGFRIVGTDGRYPENYAMKLDEGRLWGKSMEVTIGAAVAGKTGLKTGDRFHGSHGLGEGGHVHDDQVYLVTGIFEASGTVVDQLILTGLQSVWDIHSNHGQEKGHHQDEPHGEDHHGDEAIHEHVHEKADTSHHQEADREITALLVKFKNPLGMVQLPRMVNENTNMQAALPNYELTKLFSLMGMATTTLNMVAFIVILVSGISVFISLYLGLRERSYEMALLRTYGASRLQLLRLIFQEGVFIAVVGFLLGLFFSRLGLLLVGLLLESEYHYEFSPSGPIIGEGYLFLMTLAIGILSALIPAISVYKIDLSKSLSDA
ncbi:ABC transporter permease [Echinicola soli]|uniref:ABC transporter permease n=1 Tax=Echinicola soli TaxID=2591634 RepID=A0A514CND5_9BACT|nr:ABC transporter permease [Echinicola soli]QDH81333.1 ABC transporter permease [Echinicola soli]